LSAASSGALVPEPVDLSWVGVEPPAAGAGSFTFVCSTSAVTSSRLTGVDGSVEFTLEGLTFYRANAQAADRGTGRVHQVEWSRIEQAELADSSKGRPMLRITVAGTTALRAKRDPHVVRVKRKAREVAQEFADRINDEVGARRRWTRSPGSSL